MHANRKRVAFPLVTPGLLPDSLSAFPSFWAWREEVRRLVRVSPAVPSFKNDRRLTKSSVVTFHMDGDPPDYWNRVTPGTAADGVGTGPHSYFAGVKSSLELSACSHVMTWPV